MAERIGDGGGLILSHLVRLLPEHLNPLPLHIGLLLPPALRLEGRLLLVSHLKVQRHGDTLLKSSTVAEV